MTISKRILGGVLMLIAVGLAAVRGSAASANSIEARVIVLANASDPESLRLAHYYGEKRKIPAENIIALPMSSDETITWRVFVDTIYQPLQDELVARKWIDAIGTSLTDKAGRKKYAVSGHRISFLVTCRGVPLRIDHDAGLYSDDPYTQRPEFRTNCGAVDAELSLLANSGYPINAFVPNPLFRNDKPSEVDEGHVVKVSRLDGPSLNDAIGLVDHAIMAEKNGLIGRAYVDIGGPYPEGDSWLTRTASQIEETGIDLSVDQGPNLMAPADRFDAPILYFGWYAGDITGPFLQPEFQFPAGAVALHIHSFSAKTLRSARAAWCGPLVARGVTATMGNVFEPYLLMLHQPHIFFRALARGDRLGDAAFYALPALSWQEVVIGDPLYRPFGVKFADQWENRADLSDEQFPYVVIRELRLLDQGGQLQEAVKTGREAFRERPSLILAVKLAELLKANHEEKEAVELLGFVSKLETIKPSEVPVAAEVGDFLAANGAPAQAVALFNSLLARETLSREQKRSLLEKGVRAAKAAADEKVVARWTGLRSELGE